MLIAKYGNIERQFVVQIMNRPNKDILLIQTFFAFNGFLSSEILLSAVCYKFRHNIF